jgi:hypothetical protein
VNDPVNAFDCLLETIVVTQVSNDKIGIQMTDFAVITGLSYHQPGMVSAEGKLSGHLLPNKARGAGYQQSHFFITIIHFYKSHVFDIFSRFDSFLRNADLKALFRIITMLFAIFFT